MKLDIGIFFLFRSPEGVILAVCDILANVFVMPVEMLLFVHLKFLRNTWLNKIPMVFAGITTVFIGGIDHIALSGLSTFMGISMAVLTEIIIVFLAVINKEKQVEQ